jgi:hypothetical protein
MILRDFPTKSLFLVFNFWVSENTCFHVFDVSGATGIQIAKGKKPCQFFFGRKAVGTRHKGGGPGGPKGGSPRGQIPWPRVGPPNGPTAPPPRGLFADDSVFPENEHPNFPETRRSRQGGETLETLRGGDRSCCPGAPEKGEIIPIFIPISSLAWEEASPSPSSPAPASPPSPSP